MAKKKKSKGLGDDIEKVLETTGVKAVKEFLFGKDCNCDKRKEWLNKKFPRKKPECLNHKEYKFLDKLFSENKRTLSKQDNIELYTTYNRVFKSKKKSTSCSPCVKSVANELKVIYDKYKEDVSGKKD